VRLAGVLPEGFLRALPEQERKKLGRAGITAAEASATFKRGKELELQKLCMNWLLLHDIYFEYDRPDKRTSGKKGRADFRICFKGRWISCECKAAGEKLSSEQAEQAARLMRSGGAFLLIFSLDELIKALREIVAPAMARSTGRKDSLPDFGEFEK
jgi:hypothetical protein